MFKENKRLSKHTFFRVFHTVKYLRWSQVWYRLYYRVRTLRADALPGMKAREWSKAWSAPARVVGRSVLSPNDVMFLGEPGGIHTPKDWNCSKKTKLWLYNLHYLDELNSIYAPQNTALLNNFIEKWMSQNPPCLGNGWEPYPLSLRLVNLVKWYSRQKEPTSPQGLASLGAQAHALVKQLEYHIRGNHLFMNGKALVFVGAFLTGSQPNFWLKKGLKILDSEIKEQFLNDGAHFELSPMYHASLLWDLCDLVHLANQTDIAELIIRKDNWQAHIVKGFNWFRQMCHPDGGLSFFNDASFGIAPTLSEIDAYVKELGIDLPPEREKCFYPVLQKESGYCVVHIDNNSKAILDVGKIGPDYQPGHAHADSLSFELSLYGQRFFVNSGTSQYGDDINRQWQRGTKAHNTVNINNEDSSEVWAGFRVARRAYPKELSIQEAASRIKITCAHNGYLRLAGRNLHRRKWEFLPRKLTIIDRISGTYNCAEARFYFHPDITVKKVQHHTIQCDLLSGETVFIHIKYAQNIVIEPSIWHPFFGVSIKNSCLIATFKGNELVTEIEW